MLIFALDTSGPTAGVALWQDGAVRYEAVMSNKLTHSESALPMAEEAYLRTGLRVEDTDLFAAVAGPGSFTGVRIGVTTVKALARAVDKPCVAVSALEAMALSQGVSDAIICPMQNARREQVYAAAFDGRSGERLLQDQPIALTELHEELIRLAGDRPVLLTGDGMTAYREQLAQWHEPRILLADDAHCYLRPACAALLASRRASEAVSADRLTPIYLRPPQAVRQKNLVEQAEREARP